MIESLQVEGFRAFEKFSMSGLGRINLLVGDNNSGKTSVLEAIQLAATQGDLFALSSITGRRGERFWSEAESRPGRSEINVAHLFHGHSFDLGAKFEIAATGGIFAGRLEAEVIQLAGKQMTLFDEGTETGLELAARFPLAALSLRAIGDTDQSRESNALPITARGGVSLDHVRRSQPIVREGGEIEFVATAGLSIDELVTRFEAVAANPEEELVYEALRCIEADVERLVTVSGEIRRGYPSGRGGFHIKLRHLPNRIPLGVMGDGMWRLLSLILALVKARNGILLVDEIDTGLHHAVMDHMWKLINAAAAPDKLNVQVFATTHSHDCVRALASICRDDDAARNVCIQRVERDLSRSVTIKEDGVIAIAKRDIEVR